MRKVCGVSIMAVFFCTLAALAQDEPAQPANKLYRGKPLSHWIGEMKNPARHRRMAALSALAGAGAGAKDALEALGDVIGDDKFHQECALALNVLGGMGPGVDGAAAAIGKALDSRDQRTRASAAKALERFGAAASPALPRLLEMLKGGVEEAIAAAHAVGVVGPASLPLEHVPAGKDASPAWLGLPAQEESRAGSPSHALLAALKVAERDDVANALLDALGHFGPVLKDAVPELVRALANSGEKDKKDGGEKDIFTLRKTIRDLEAEIAKEKDAVIAKEKDAVEKEGPVTTPVVPGGPVVVEPPVVPGGPVERGGEARIRWIVPGKQPTLITLAYTSFDEDGVRPARVESILIRIGADAVPAVAALLGHDNPKAREAAVRVLAQIGPAAVPALARTLESTDASAVSAALDALNRLGPKAAEAAPALVKRIAEDDAGPRDGARGALVEIGAPAVPALAQALRNPDAKVRQAAADILGMMDPTTPPEMLQLLIPLLKDPVESVRSSAASNMGTLGARLHSAECVPALVENLRDRKNQVIASVEALGALGPLAKDAVPDLIAATHVDHQRRQAVEALGRIGAAAKAAVPRLAELLNDDELNAGEAAALSLFCIGPEAHAAIPALLKAIKNFDDDSDRRTGAIYALAIQGVRAKAAVPALLETLKNEDEDEETRLAAIRALACLAPDGAGPASLPAGAVSAALLELLDSDDDDIRRAAALSLSVVGVADARAALTRLTDCLKDEDEYEVQMALVEAISHAIGNRDASAAVKALLPVQKDDDEDVRAAAAWELARLGPAARDAVHALLEALKDDQWEVRAPAVLALARAAPEGEPWLQEVMALLVEEDDESVRLAIGAALLRFGGAGVPPAKAGETPAGGDARPTAPAQWPALQALIQALRNEKDSDVCETAARALGVLGAREALPALIVAFHDDDSDVASQALLALGGLGDGAAEALPALYDLLRQGDDLDSDVLEAAFLALARIRKSVRASQSQQ